MRISFDLDNTIFDVTNIYIQAWEKTAPNLIPSDTLGYPTVWNVYTDPKWPKDVCDCLIKLFKDGSLLQFKCSTTLADLINTFINNPAYDVYFITDRPEHLDSFGQLVNSGINANKNKLILASDKKSVITQLDIQMHFDDNPIIIESLAAKFIGVLPILITNEKTLYNHKTRDTKLRINEQQIAIPQYKDLYTALTNFEHLLHTLELCKKSQMNNFI